jgi:sigma-E factor negative regulatory protein RseA
MKEQVSALLDGELASPERAAVFDAMKADDAIRKDWRAYCLVSDALRGECGPGRDISAAVMAALDHEPTVISGFSPNRAEARNDSWWSRAMPMAAAVLGVAVVAWAGLGLKPADLVSPAEVAQLAPKVRHGQATSPAPSDVETNRAYLLAHNGYAGAQTMPGVGYYMRTVAESSTEEPAR